MNQLSLRKVASVTALFMGAFAISVFASSWSPASCGAPGCNTEGPITEDRVRQTKTGALTIDSSSPFANGSNLDVVGLLSSTGLSVPAGIASADTVEALNVLKVKGNNAEKTGYVLTNNGAGVAEWKPSRAGALTISEVRPFILNVKRNGGLQTRTTPDAYKFCSLTRIESEMSRVDAGGTSTGYCKATKKADGKWTLTGHLNDDPDYLCEMYCFR